MNKIKIYTYAIALIAFCSCDSYEDYDMTAPDPVPKIGVKEHAGDLVTMSNNSENAASYLWDFGDGNQSTEKEPSHTFELPGDWKVLFTAFSEGYIKAAIDSIAISIPGSTGNVDDFVGVYDGTIQVVGGPKLEFTDTTTRVQGENAIIFGNLLRAKRLEYESWGYSTTETTGDRAKIILEEDGMISIPLQYLYHIDGFGYTDDVYIQGRGKYNATTGSLSLEYQELFLADGLDWDGEGITERVIIARKR